MWTAWCVVWCVCRAQRAGTKQNTHTHTKYLTFDIMRILNSIWKIYCAECNFSFGTYEKCSLQIAKLISWTIFRHNFQNVACTITHTCMICTSCTIGLVNSFRIIPSDDGYDHIKSHFGPTEKSYPRNFHNIEMENTQINGLTRIRLNIFTSHKEQRTHSNPTIALSF